MPPRRTPSVRVLGVDGCARGWAGIVWDGSAVEGLFSASLRGLLHAAGEVAAVAVDMPIGLADTGVRAADIAAKQALGAKGSSLFVTPVREAVHAAGHSEATEVNRRLEGAGVTAQAWALVPKIREVDALVREGVGIRLVEAHPELSFAAMGSGPVAAPKRTFTGAAQRRTLLRSHGLDLESVDLGDVGLLAAADDVVDAAALAWTAMRVARCTAVSRPDPPVIHSDGWPAAIWT